MKNEIIIMNDTNDIFFIKKVDRKKMTLISLYGQETIVDKDVNFEYFIDEGDKNIEKEFPIFFRIINGESQRERSFIGAVLEPNYVSVRLYTNDDDEQERVVKYFLKTDREDIDGLNMAIYNLELVYSTKDYTQMDLIKGDEVSVKKRTKYMKQKGISLKDIFVVDDFYGENTIVKDKEGKVHYFENYLLKKK